MTLNGQHSPGGKLHHAFTAGGSLSLSVGALAVILDQLTKHWAALALSDDPLSGPRFFGGWLALTYTTNTGAAFGVLADRGILFLFIGLVVLGVVIAYWRFLPTRRPMLRISLGLQLGGATGNLIDRVREGHVIDFIQIRSLSVFNLADSAIVCGVALLMFYLMSSPEDPAARTRGDEKQDYPVP